VFVADLETMTPGQVLADANVAEFIKAMGLSIAEAQKALDLNSIAQVGEYAEQRPGLDNKSLLQLGLSPPFYHYQHADLTVSMQLTMKVGNSESFGVGAKLDIGFGTKTGSGSGGNTRLAQVTLKSVPASVTVDATKLDAPATDVDDAAEALADKLRAPAGKFERVFVQQKTKAIATAVDPAGTNPLLTTGAIAFLPTADVGTALIRITETPPTTQSETFLLATGKSATVPAAADRVQYARAVRDALNGLTGFKATLVRDAGNEPKAPDAPGVVSIVLFDTGSARLKPAALVELQHLATLLKDGTQRLKVHGYTDLQGEKDKVNVPLAKERAERVRTHLVSLGIADTRIDPASTPGESRWTGTSETTPNAQFRRVEILLEAATDLFIVVEEAGGTLQATPTPDKTGGGAGNGFVAVTRTTGRTIAADTKVKIGDAQTAITLSGAAVNTSGDVLAANSPEAFAFNLAQAINAKSAEHKARASRKGTVVYLAGADDAVLLDLLILSSDDIKLTADGGASISKPLEKITAAGAKTEEPAKSSNFSVAVGASIDYRTSRMFETSVNGNSSISARIVSVPAPVEFLDEIRKFLAPRETTASSTSTTTAPGSTATSTTTTTTGTTTPGATTPGASTDTPTP
jgi:outer membrane protein OmpA-like peptidoglycan-associated protein